MKIEEVRIDEISNHERNPKQHPDKQIRLLEESIKRFGWTNPVILDKDGRILAGHARVKAAIEMGQDSIPCIRTKLSGKDADAYLLADNRLSDIAPYDRDILAELLSDLPKDLVDLTGFDSVQVDALLAGEDIPDIEKFISDSQPEEPRPEVDAEPQIDRAEELNKIWQVKTGDLWQCGEHRLICGDCTDPAVVERVMGGEKADLAAVDPPYNVGFEYDGETVDDKKTEEMYENFSKKWFKLCQTVSTRQIVTPGCNNLVSWLRWFDIFHCAPWTKTNSMTNGKVSRFWCWEPVLFFGDKWGKSRSNDVFDFPIGMQKGVANHPCPKPLKMWENLIDNYSGESSIIFESFCGSGTTLIACENTGRKCRGVEISPEYCAVILQRFKEATGKEPVRINE